MKKILTLLAFAPLTLLAQTTHEVEVGGSLSGGNLPYYAPQHITIDVGDIVHWTNVSGEHQVDGSLGTFPDNPEGFSNGQPEQDWEFSYTFDTPGVYDYHCDNSFNGQNHSTTQFGTITVIDPSGVATVATNNAISLHPIPADEMVVLSLKGCTGVVSVDILTSSGSLVRTQAVVDNSPNNISLVGLPAGQYYVRMDRMNRRVIKPFVKL